MVTLNLSSDTCELQLPGLANQPTKDTSQCPTQTANQVSSIVASHPGLGQSVGLVILAQSKPRPIHGLPKTVHWLDHKSRLVWPSCNKLNTFNTNKQKLQNYMKVMATLKKQKDV